MPDIEYLTASKFYFEVDGITDLLVQKVSGPEIELSVAGGDAPIGCTKGGKTQTHSVIGGVKYNSTITLTYVAGNEGTQKKLWDWYVDCHAKAYTGGEVKARSSRKTGSLVVYDGDGAEGMRFNFTDLFPVDITQAGGDLSPDKAGEIAVDTLQLGFTQVIRKA